MTLLYASTIFLSAFLLFQIQPIVGKMILPWFGGSAAVWSTCMLFFQLLLLLGYLYAHLTVRYLRPRRQAVLHIVLLAASVALLPIVPDASWKPAGDADPSWRILGLMAAMIGLPYFLLSSTGPLLQAWYAREEAGRIPYRLFALSNFGSMIGLLSYPLFFEPRLATRAMSLGWSVGYGVFALCCMALSVRGARLPAAMSTGAPATAQEAVQQGARWRWTALAALPTVLLMSVTSHLTENIAPIPLLWVLPLVLYLLSFILCFEGGGWYRRDWYLPAFAAMVPLMIVLCMFPLLLNEHVLLQVLFFSIGLFVCCMVCHGELARLKPAPARLTAYYLMIAAGGAIGGMFVALLAPRLFNDNYELPVAAIGALLLVFHTVWREPDVVMPFNWSGESWKKAIVFTSTLSVCLYVGKELLVERGINKARNFYGIVKVRDVGEGKDAVRQLSHGIILHGFQYQRADRRRWPTSYYGTASGAGVGMAASRTEAPQRVGVVGLGAGTMAAYCRPGDYYRFYEINPLVSQLARSAFSFLSDCKATVDIAHGDARLSLEAEPPQHFDLIVLDAFSGDAIPVHLLTREAFGEYFRHLNGGGVLAVHVSNLHLDLVPVVQSAAAYYQRDSFLVDSYSDPQTGVARAQWVLVGRPASIAHPERIRHVAAQAPRHSAIRPWTDDYSSIVSILK
ncbi:fused MFS/spermidine synthase [Duganella sp. LX20W]|uniref:Fused MFS/spermidine synthase n=1 Tax=Rugamonas brunnea TaxID=2758569 RepID=A0A7W2EQ17_9BURK|nr:fused MFS/spermidine synthase [Rugamonas brunnea]MBA5636550.1 fused MFS/spermidine synthase [Rugamonas brunnea]